MHDVTDIAAALVAAINLAAAAGGAWSWRRMASPRWFWVLVRTGQAGAIVLAALAGILLVTGYDAPSELLWLYLLLPIAVSIVAEQLRIASAQSVLDANDLEDARAVGLLPEHEQHLLVSAILRREVGIMAIAALVIAFLAVRVLATT